ncbi:hypothetical protein Fot_04547 [Forsythia ovata]|uniref:Uncharacterized protein n=1 Tax=Forsythia ovata TaxID=205694 RepID=A0ABD1XFX7_9LAMI
MGKKQRESDVRKKADFVKFLRGLDEECSGSGRRVGATSVECKGPSLPPLDESSAGLKEIREEDSQLSPKSLSCSRTLGPREAFQDSPVVMLGASSSAGIDRAAATKDRLKDILAKRLFKNKYPREHIWDELKKQERYKRNEGSTIS